MNSAWPINADAFILSLQSSFGTMLGGFAVIVLAALFSMDPNAKQTNRFMGVLQALSGGFMIFMCCFHLVPESVELIGERETMQFFFAGVGCFGLLEYFLDDEQSQDDVHRASFVTFVAMALHNIPEGLSVYLTAMTNPLMGAQMAVAIMLHKVPEGMAVALPLYASTKSTAKVAFWTTVNGLAEPAGVLVGGIFLGPYLDEYILSRCLALVGGLMFAISVHELLPVAVRLCGKDTASVAMFGGMFLCWCALEAVHVYFEHEPARPLAAAPTVFRNASVLNSNFICI
ncbi:hypothetical protein HDU91_002134 [Kappamyces sp. JEL0680]|nr:hypothetical protein HDU91_002134 [Kappamyces sp. JEL0680]